MKKTVTAMMMLAVLGVYAGQITLPEEQLAIPKVEGLHQVCIWDETANNWYTAFFPYDHSGSISFQLPQWGRWYWIGLWDEQAGEYVFGKWIGHFISE